MLNAPGSQRGGQSDASRQHLGGAGCVVMEREVPAWVTVCRSGVPEGAFSSAEGTVLFAKPGLRTNKALWLFHRGKKK